MYVLNEQIIHVSPLSLIAHGQLVKPNLNDVLRLPKKPKLDSDPMIADKIKSICDPMLNRRCSLAVVISTCLIDKFEEKNNVYLVFFFFFFNLTEFKLLDFIEYKCHDSVLQCIKNDACKLTLSILLNS